MNTKASTRHENNHSIFTDIHACSDFSNAGVCSIEWSFESNNRSDNPIHLPCRWCAYFTNLANYKRCKGHCCPNGFTLIWNLYSANFLPMFSEKHEPILTILSLNEIWKGDFCGWIIVLNSFISQAKIIFDYGILFTVSAAANCQLFF